MPRSQNLPKLNAGCHHSIPNENMNHKPSFIHSFIINHHSHSPKYPVISHCFAEVGWELNKEIYFTCTAIVLLIKPFVLWCAVVVLVSLRSLMLGLQALLALQSLYRTCLTLPLCSYNYHNNDHNLFTIWLIIDWSRSLLLFPPDMILWMILM